MPSCESRSSPASRRLRSSSLAPNVLAIHLEEVERAEDGDRVASMRADEVEHGQARLASRCLTLAYAHAALAQNAMRRVA
jgi:hypothetical protein